MLKFFSSVTHDEYTIQQQRIAAQTSLLIAEQQQQAAQQLAKRGPGRPKKPQQLHPRDTTDEADAEEARSKRGKYTNWFATPVIHHILREFQLTGHSSRKAVANLQRALPNVYSSLSYSTIDSWFDKSFTPPQLKPQYQTLLDQAQTTIARGPGCAPLFAPYPELEEDIKNVLQQLRQNGGAVNISIIRWVMQTVLEKKQPDLLSQTKLSKAFISSWVHSRLSWSWKTRTTAASKLPLDWRAQGITMAKRIAAGMQLEKIHPSLIINLDQTGMHLAPSSHKTYETKGEKTVPVIAAEDKRQITVVLASSMNGNMLPLQFVFQGETARCLPPVTPAIVAAEAHLTHSSNHWSNLETMKQYVKEIIVPYYNKQIEENRLAANSKLMLVLDAWSVHRSEEFRLHLRMHYPYIWLVFVPANCTSKLQVADVALQRPFKHGVRQRFDQWGAETIKEQMKSGKVTGLSDHLRMKSIKPLIVGWCLASWQKLREQKQYIILAWHTCCSSFFDVNDPRKRIEAVEEVALEQLDRLHIPKEDEEEKERNSESDDSESEHEESDSSDELDVMSRRIFGTRRSARARNPPKRLGFRVNVSQVDFVATGSEDSDANGM